MINFISKLNKNLDLQLQSIDLEESDLIKKAQKSTRCIKNALTQLKLFNIESRRPTGSHEIQEDYLRNELNKLTFFFNNHLEFYQYYRMNSTYLDDKYFVQGKEDMHLYQDSLMFYVNPNFSTSQDYMVTKIVAYDCLEVFLTTEIEALSFKAANPNCGYIGFSEQNLQ